MGLILEERHSPALKKFLPDLLKSSAHVLYHAVVVALSAGIGLSLPFIITFIANNFFLYWSLVENERRFLVSVEIGLAVLLILFFNYIGRSWKDRKFAKMARGAGMAYFFPSRGPLAQRRIKKLKELQGFVRDVLVISSTGSRTFVDPGGDLRNVLQNCREAKIMLLNPHGRGARSRANSILDPNVTPENFNEQIKKSIEFLKGLKAVQKNVKLKLYENSPFLKLVILGDYIWMKHYHPGLDVHSLPEFVFEHNQTPGSLYTPLYQYFLTRWADLNIPEYDFESDELVYRDEAGNERQREKFDAAQTDMPSRDGDRKGSFHQDQEVRRDEAHDDLL
ncbi:MAG: hypothetical protein HYU47_08790 [Deltaproteobacteria bacterium]|nr:hypothetical protein [Deltaproteobacteria bacterium]